MNFKTCFNFQAIDKTAVLGNAYASHIGQSSAVFSKLKLRRAQSMEESNNNEYAKQLV